MATALKDSLARVIPVPGQTGVESIAACGTAGRNRRLVFD